MIKFSLFLTFIFCTLFCNCVNSKIFNSHCDQEGNREVISCASYVECNDGQYVTKYCRPGEKFDLEQKTCGLFGVFLDGCDYCDFNGKKAVKGSKTKYMYCDGGSLIVGKCDGYFDRLWKECKPINKYHSVRNNYHIGDSMVLESDSQCEPNKRISIDGSCRSYMECDSTSKWVHRKCSECQNFEPSSLKCVWAWKYYCTPSTPTTSSSTEPPTTGSSTSEQPTSTSEQPTSTSEQPTSTSEQPTSTSEQPTSTSEQPTSTTDIPTTVTTEKPTSTGTTPKSTTSKGSSTTISTTTSSATSTTTKVPDCTKEGQKKVFKAGDCKDYLECDSGKWVKKSCSFGYDFDVNKLACTWSWWAHC